MAKNKIIGNIFDLTQIGSSVVDVQAEQVIKAPPPYDPALLKDYVLVDAQHWYNIQPGTQIRYLRKDGHFRNGGFVTDVSETQDTEGNNTLRFDLVSNYTPSAIKWSLFRGSIDKIWEKLTETTAKQPEYMLAISELQKELQMCKETVAMLEKNIQKINNEQMRTVLLIKKLHNIQ